MKKLFFTITGCNFRYGTKIFRPGMPVGLVKEPDNKHDREAIKVVMEGLGLVGYVANSIRTVRGLSLSAGRLYDKIGDAAAGKVMYVLDDGIICYVTDTDALPEEIDDLCASADDETLYDTFYDDEPADMSDVISEDTDMDSYEDEAEADAGEADIQDEIEAEKPEAEAVETEEPEEPAGIVITKDSESDEDGSAAADAISSLSEQVKSLTGQDLDPDLLAVISSRISEAMDSETPAEKAPETAAGPAVQEEEKAPSHKPVITKISLDDELDEPVKAQDADADNVTVFNKAPGLTIVHRAEEDESNAAGETAEAAGGAAETLQSDRQFFDNVAQALSTDNTAAAAAAVEEAEPEPVIEPAVENAEAAAAVTAEAPAEAEDPAPEAEEAEAEPEEAAAEPVPTEKDEQEKKAEELGFKKLEVKADDLETGDPDLDEKLSALNLGDLDARYLSPAFIDKLKKTLSE